MKIAIILRENSPANGGSYSFEQQMLNGIMRFTTHSKHKFIFYSCYTLPPSTIINSDKKQISFIYPKLDFFKKTKFLILYLAKSLVKRILYGQNNPTNRSEFEIALDSFIDQDDIDIIWSFTPSCPVINKPFILTVWDLQHRLQPYFPEVSHGREWERRENQYQHSLSKASYIITGTERGKQEIQCFYGTDPERIKVFPFPKPEINKGLLPLEEKQILDELNIHENYLFYPAQFWPHKNHIVILLAAKILKEEYKIAMPIVFVGSDKGNLNYIQAKSQELGLLHQIHFLGFVPTKTLITLYKNAFALVFMSFFGPDNLPPLEAFELGCPVIAADVPGSQEQLGDSALLVNPKDQLQLADTIYKLKMDNDLRNNLTNKGKQKVNQWTVESYIMKMFRLFDEFETISRTWKNTEQ